MVWCQTTKSEKCRLLYKNTTGVSFKKYILFFKVIVHATFVFGEISAYINRFANLQAFFADEFWAHNNVAKNYSLSWGSCAPNRVCKNHRESWNFWFPMRINLRYSALVMLLFNRCWWQKIFSKTNVQKQKLNLKLYLI